MAEQNNRELYPASFVENAFGRGVHIFPLAGDASHRLYWRVVKDEKTAICMFMPPPPSSQEEGGYAPQTGLATTVTPFVALSFYLKDAGLRVPEIYAYDLEKGYVLLEDFGDNPYTSVTNKESLYEEAIQALLMLHRQSHPEHIFFAQGSHILPTYSLEILLREVEVWGQWFLKEDTWRNLQSVYRQTWCHLFKETLSKNEETIVLRDFHSPNLLWCQEQKPTKRLGIIDFQDAAIGPAAYDVVSLLQDAREDVDPLWEEKFLGGYLARRRQEKHFNEENFLKTYACLGAQRATKIVGIFCRLKHRDDKPGYMKNIPRVLAYLKRNLEQEHLKDIATLMKPYLP